MIKMSKKEQNEKTRVEAQFTPRRMKVATRKGVLSGLIPKLLNFTPRGVSDLERFSWEIFQLDKKKFIGGSLWPRGPLL